MKKKLDAVVLGLSMALAVLAIILACVVPVGQESRVEAAYAAKLTTGALAGAAFQGAVGPSIPQGVCVFWPGDTTIPAGWTRETSLDARYLKGANAGANPNATGGSASHTHSSSHSHTMNNHTHNVTVGAVIGTSGYHCKRGDSYPSISHDHNNGGAGYNPGLGTYSVSTESVTYSAVSNELSNRRAILIRSEGTTRVPPDAMAALASSTVPAGWNLCDGTNGTLDYRDRYAKGADGGGAAGGATSAGPHNHDIDHAHSISHTHASFTTGGPSGYSCGAGSSEPIAKVHTHTVTVQTDVQNRFDDLPPLSFGAVEPAYRKMLPIQNRSGTADSPKGIVGLWLGTLDTIPSGWTLCDGSNGTQDMRGRFLKFASSAGEVGTAGGSATHNHGSSSHTHPAFSHSHACDSGSSCMDAHVQQAKHETSGSGGYSRYATPVGSKHAVGCSTNSFTLSNGLTTSSEASHEPPYRTVAFIQYVNTPPQTPSDPMPGDDETIDNDSPQLSWSVSDVDQDPVTCFLTLSANSDLSNPIQDNLDTGAANSFDCPPLPDGTYYWQVRADDGSASSSSDIWSFTVQTAPVTVTVDQAAGQPDPTNESFADFTAIFSEPVSGFDAQDVLIEGTAGGGTVAVTGGPSEYAIRVSGFTEQGTVIVSIPAGAAYDAAGNQSMASTHTDNSVFYTLEGSPTILGWQSVVTHGNGVGPIAIDLDPAKTDADLGANGPTVESRFCGLQTVTVQFSDAVQPTDGQLDLNDVLIQDSSMNSYSPISVALTEGDTRLEIRCGSMPTNRRYTISVAGKFVRQVPPHLLLLGDGDCQVRLAVGDSNNDGDTNLIDVAQVKSLNHTAVSPSLGRCDINRDGYLDLIDAAVVRSRQGHSAW